jgi:hypothetical protein
MFFLAVAGFAQAHTERASGIIFENNKTGAPGLSAVVNKTSIPFESLGRYIEAELFDPRFREGESNYHTLAAVSDGKIHFSVNSRDPNLAGRYYRFDPATKAITFVAEMDSALGEDAKTQVPQGKIHTPLIEHDGKVWFATMASPFERGLPGTGNYGKLPFGGAHFVSYDLRTGQFTALGKAIPSEGIITMNMDTKNKILYGLTWPSGLLVSYDITGDEVHIWGAVQGRGEWGHLPFERDAICRTLAIAPEGNVYGSTMDGMIWHYDRTQTRRVSYIDGLDLARVPRVRSAEEELKGDFNHGWRVIRWNPNTSSFWGLHFETTTLFEFVPSTRLIRAVAELRPKAYRGMPRNPQKSQLGFMIGPGNTIFYLAHGPAVALQGQPALQSNLYLLTYDIDKARLTDHGPIFSHDGRRVYFAESIAIGPDDHIYTVAWVEVPSANQKGEPRLSKRGEGQAAEAALSGMQETANAQYQILLARLAKWQTFSQLPKEKPVDNGAKLVLEIENLTVTDESLTLDYEVTNPFTSNIWICKDVDDFGRYDVETRIADGTLQIELRGDLEANWYITRIVYAKYRRLSPAESHSGRILLKLPVRNGSPRYDFGESGKEQKLMVLHRAVLKVGYFEKDFRNIASEKFSKGEWPTNEEACIELLLQLDPGAERYPSSHNIVYLPHWWPGLSREKSAKVVVTDVDIPCSVVVDDK